MPEIGETLRETRMRRRIDMTEVEAATKIRAKYLRALENEEWDLLPGPTFVKTFLRTYAEYLDLDPRLLVEEYRQRYERPATQDLTPFGPGMGGAAPARGASGGRSGRSWSCCSAWPRCSARCTLLGVVWGDPNDGGSRRRTAPARPPTATATATPAKKKSSRRARRRRRRRA